MLQSLLRSLVTDVVTGCIGKPMEPFYSVLLVGTVGKKMDMLLEGNLDLSNISMSFQDY